MSRVVAGRRAAALLINVVNVVVTAVFLGTLVYALVGVTVSSPGIVRMWRTVPGDSLPLSDSIDFVFLKILLGITVMTYVGMYVLPTVLALTFFAPIVALWEHPPVFLFLRPFHRGTLSRPLKRIARRHMAALGHIYTLSDVDIHVPWYVRVPVLLGQPAFFSFRPHRIRTPGDVEGLDRVINRTWLRNINWCLSWNKLFPVASDDPHWQAAIHRLLTRSRCVVIDITGLREHVIWEIQQARELVTEDGIIYVAAADERDENARRLRSILSEAGDLRVFPYDQTGLVEPDRFCSALSQAIAHGTRSRQGADPLAILGSVLFMAGLLPVLALAIPVAPPWLPHWNPWPDPAAWPGFAAVLSDAGVATLSFGLLTWVTLALAARRNKPIRVLLVVQTLLLLAAPLGMLDW